ncbi:MAG TPA: Mpo1-like protein, partial [Terriglobales bacterium]|nr:Mpo1-like protein [Terriglobales bacterium]
MLGGKSSAQWIAQYATSHQHPVNRMCHTFGIPTIVVSLALFVAAIFFHSLLWYAVGLFVFGWALQFIGHAFEGKEPEFFHDWRFLFVGL